MRSAGLAEQEHPTGRLAVVPGRSSLPLSGILIRSSSRKGRMQDMRNGPTKPACYRPIERGPNDESAGAPGRKARALRRHRQLLRLAANLRRLWASALRRAAWTPSRIFFDMPPTAAWRLWWSSTWSRPTRAGWRISWPGTPPCGSPRPKMACPSRPTASTRYPPASTCPSGPGGCA